MVHLSDIGTTTSNTFSQAAGEDDSNDFTSSNPQSNSSNYGEVAVELIIEQREAALVVNLLSVNRYLPTTLYVLSLAARVRNSSSQLSHIHPVFVRANSTAVQVILDKVPGCGDALETLLAIVFLAFLHILGDL